LEQNMPERHRGAHPEDAKNFAAEQLDKLKTAVAELSWLLSRGYAVGASSALVGDRYQLTSRQRLAVSRVACTDDQAAARQAKCLPVSALNGRTLLIDGFNLLITIETALGGGAIFSCADGCCRDLSSVYGAYRFVAETRTAIEQIGRTLEQASPEKVLWLFDRPVSNSARVAKTVRDIAAEHHWPFDAEITDSTDTLLRNSGHIVITCDSAILEQAENWSNLACEIIARQIPEVWMVDMTA
jgi:hypothetical protein